MKLANLSSEILEKIKVSRFDQIIEKHEGPERWVSALDYLEPEIMFVNGYYVLLPVDKDNHPNIKILRCIELYLTIFYHEWFIIEPAG